MDQISAKIKKEWEYDAGICLNSIDSGTHYGGSVNPPIVMSSFFSFDSHESFSQALRNECDNVVYSRGNNPTVAALEKKLAQLERGEKARCFASGMGAITAALFAILNAGDHVIAVNNIYDRTIEYLEHAASHQISLTYLRENFTIDAIREAIRSNTKLIYFESPASTLFTQVDITAITALAREHGILTMMDNTWATPLFQKPLLMGVDIVAHSLTKYVSGHSDFLAGALVCSAEMMRKIFSTGYMLQGAVLSPFVAYLALRGLRTLPVRLKEHEKNALQIAQFLHEHSKVRCVHHPALNNAEEAFFGKQLTGYAGVFSFVLDTKKCLYVKGFIDRLKYFHRGLSWGGFESMVIAPYLCKQNKQCPCDQSASPNKHLVRVSIGLEPLDMLIQDLSQALEFVEKD